MTEKELKDKIIDKAEIIANGLHKGKDIEVRKSASGISVAEISKKVVSK
jgi:hypothetical protein